ncbi:paraquat-inducible protein A [Ferruginibacter lapsinanis]|uniref:paraquat-inducible protein A n=1 Tax=Ferruginibacter lapsinanis TaxID=563172 RepID=UPI001E56A021|nr:paraquat-inducible protein A [Ferruginibacter lapsinanis]UEG50207.1 paraquat-inducible protein A [Ferruginibacter lapsinanis]
MLKIDISAHFVVDLSLFNEKRSIISMLRSLWVGANYFPFCLIAFFGMIIPLLKSGVIFYILLDKKENINLYRYMTVISKWAMADVFAISILVAFFSANAMENINANLEPGFYFFSSYVLLSAIVTTLLGKIVGNQSPINS